MILGAALFEKELALIQNVDLKNYLTEVLDKDIHYDNFLLPSSSSGKYHPDHDLGEYGNANHTKAVVKLCNVLLSSRTDLDSYFHDIIYASAILHDQWKYDGNSQHTLSNHAEIAASFLKKKMDTLEENNPLKKYLYDMICVIFLHMGHWGFSEGEWKKKLDMLSPEIRDCALIVHYSDMISSRTFYNVKNFSL